jgi:hypothetical protein
MSQEQINEQVHIEAMNEVLSIQGHAMHIATNGLLHKITVHKKPVNKFVLDYLSVYFKAPITHEGATQYIRIVSDHCDIIVKKEIINPNTQPHVDATT